MPEKPCESIAGFLAFAMASNGMASAYSIWSGNLKEFYLSRELRGKFGEKFGENIRHLQYVRNMR